MIFLHLFFIFCKLSKNRIKVILFYEDIFLVNEISTFSFFFWGGWGGVGGVCLFCVCLFCVCVFFLLLCFFVLFLLNIRFLGGLPVRVDNSFLRRYKISICFGFFLILYLIVCFRFFYFIFFFLHYMRFVLDLPVTDWESTEHCVNSTCYSSRERILTWISVGKIY